MAVLVACLWFHLAGCLRFLVGFVGKLLSRLKREHGSHEDVTMEKPQIQEEKPKEEEDCNGSEKEETSSLRFKFEYQLSERGSSSSNEEPEFFAHAEKNKPSSIIANTSKYRFLSEKDFSALFREPEALTRRVRESYVACEFEHLRKASMTDVLEALHDEFGAYESKDALFLKKHKLFDVETNSIAGIDGIKFQSEEFSGFDSDSESSTSDGYSVRNLVVDSDSDGFSSERDLGGYEGESDGTESRTDSKSFRAAQSHCSCGSPGSESNGCKEVALERRNYLEFHGDDIVEREIKLPTEEMKLKEDDGGTRGAALLFSHSFDAEILQLSARNSSSSNTSPSRHSPHSDEIWSEDEFRDHRVELKELNQGSESSEVLLLEETPLPGSTELTKEFIDGNSTRAGDDDILAKQDTLDGEDAEKDGASQSLENGSNQVNETIVGGSDELVPKADDFIGTKEDAVKNINKSELCHSKDWNEEDSDELESLWEHQDLIEQLRMEIKKARAIGLPTILEESESPKTIEDIKPWKIDEKFLHENPMDELNKFYKSYRERMRKFDILNYQKMYAIGFLQLKDPLQSLGTQKPLLPTLTSLLSKNLRPFRHRKCSNDPSKKFIKELQSDLETVYVGQACLSWEFLRWQYEKARELPESDTHRSHQYNQVAGEFQQFQVVVQRFLENESFQGPRLANYVKSRCVLRNLLQVPVIKEDCKKEKMAEQKKGNSAITSEMLQDIMEESIRILWEFIKADKDETPAILKGLLGSQVELQNPSDLEIMVDAQAILLKKEKKLKDILRTGNCIVKKFKKPREDRSNQDLFFSQVDLKLVSRVLSMIRITTDQLIWCHKMLSKITFSERKVKREPSFLLFPCS